MFDCPPVGAGVFEAAAEELTGTDVFDDEAGEEMIGVIVEAMS